MKHFQEKYYIEPDLIKKPEIEEDEELSDYEISDEFVPVEDGEETNTVEVREPNDDNETSTIVEADERNDDDRMNATAVDVRNNGNEKKREQSDDSVIIIDCQNCERNCNEISPENPILSLFMFRAI